MRPLLYFRLFIISQGEDLSGMAELQGFLEILGKQGAISIPWSQDHSIGRAEKENARGLVRNTATSQFGHMSLIIPLSPCGPGPGGCAFFPGRTGP